jgi:hypothetical protein
MSATSERWVSRDNGAEEDVSFDELWDMWTAPTEWTMADVLLDKLRFHRTVERPLLEVALDALLLR